jgi:hypothetical protein
LHNFLAEAVSAMIALFNPNYSIANCRREISVMARPVKAIATLASVAVLACSIFAVSWVGLALLGY